MINKLTHILILIFFVGLLTQCSSQKTQETITTGTNAGAVDAHAIPESEAAKIEIKVPDYNIEKNSMEYLQSLPMPELWFVFESQGESKIDLPEDVKQILENYWQKAIEICYKGSKILNKSLTAQEDLDNDIEFLLFSNKQKNLMLKQTIETPNGKRKIASNETSQIITLINLAASTIIERAEKVN